MYYDWIFVITRMHALVQSHDHTCVIKLIINDVWRFSILLPCRDSYAQELPFELFRLLHSTVGLLYLLMEQNKSVRYMVKGFSNVSHSMKFHNLVFSSMNCQYIWLPIVRIIAVALISLAFLFCQFTLM